MNVEDSQKRAIGHSQGFQTPPLPCKTFSPSVFPAKTRRPAGSGLIVNNTACHADCAENPTDQRGRWCVLRIRRKFGGALDGLAHHGAHPCVHGPSSRNMPKAPRSCSRSRELQMFLVDDRLANGCVGHRQRLLKDSNSPQASGRVPRPHASSGRSIGLPRATLGQNYAFGRGSDARHTPLQHAHRTSVSSR